MNSLHHFIQQTTKNVAKSHVGGRAETIPSQKYEQGSQLSSVLSLSTAEMIQQNGERSFLRIRNHSGNASPQAVESLGRRQLSRVVSSSGQRQIDTGPRHVRTRQSFPSTGGVKFDRVIRPPTLLAKSMLWFEFGIDACVPCTEK